MAVWNREKIVILVSYGVWVADVAFLINGEYSSTDHRRISYKPGDISGGAQVNFSTLTLLDLLSSFANRRSVICGRMSATLASCLTQRA